MVFKIGKPTILTFINVKVTLTIEAKEFRLQSVFKHTTYPRSYDSKHSFIKICVDFCWDEHFTKCKQSVTFLAKFLLLYKFTEFLVSSEQPLECYTTTTCCLSLYILSERLLHILTLKMLHIKYFLIILPSGLNILYSSLI